MLLVISFPRQSRIAKRNRKEKGNNMLSVATSTISNQPSIFAKLRRLVSPPPKKQTQTLNLPTHPVLLAANFERVFRHFDEDGDGKISPSELRSCMIRTVGEELSDEDVEAVVEYSDSDGDGLLCLDDFVRLVDAEEEEERMRSIKEAFRVYEMEGRGCITCESLRRALGKLGMKRSVKDCEAMIREFDVDGDGVICFEEFRIMMLI